MAISIMILALQVGATGPVLPEENAAEAVRDETLVTFPCEGEAKDEITVCVRRTDNRAQRLEAPDSDGGKAPGEYGGGPLSVRLGERTKLTGGGPKDSVGVGLKQEF